MAKEKLGNGNGNGLLALPDANASGALAVNGGNTLATVDTLDQLAEVEGFAALQIDDDGLTEMGAEDIKLSAKIWNTKAQYPNGDPVPKNMFFDTVTEEVAKELDLVFIKVHKTNEWSKYNDTLKRTEVFCRSFDQIAGTVQTETGGLSLGTIRPCEGCPDAKWESIVDPKDGKVKRTRRCGPVYNAFAVELRNHQPCVIRFKRTGLPVIQQYLSRHHLGRRPVRDPKTNRVQMANYPLFSFACKVTLKMHPGGEYAMPVLERGQVLPAPVIAQAAETVAYVNTVLLPNKEKFAKLMDSDSSDEGDTSFDTSKMTASEGKDFVESPQG